MYLCPPLKLHIYVTPMLVWEFLQLFVVTSSGQNITLIQQLFYAVAAVGWNYKDLHILLYSSPCGQN